MAQDIDPYDIDKEVGKLIDWHRSENPDALQKSFKFKNFVDTFRFMTSCAAYAEKIGHHPDWRNVYNKLDVTLTTHDTGGLSNLDILMAKYMDELEIAMNTGITN
jgi:4a-hydroxytetrahydrobiopterin dehydratase